MFIVSAMVKEIKTNLLTVNVTDKAIGLVGMTFVFETKEQALKAYPEADLVEIKLIDMEVTR